MKNQSIRTLAIIFFYIVYFLFYFLIPIYGKWYDYIPSFLSSFLKDFSFMKYVSPPEDLTDSITIKGVNEKITDVCRGIANIGIVGGGGFAIKTVMNGVPTPAGKVVVGTFGLASLFATTQMGSVFQSSTRGPKNSFVPFRDFFNYSIPSEPDSRALEICSWVGPFSAETILLLLIILFIELFRKSLLKWICETQFLSDLLSLIKHTIPTWLTNYTYKTSESISLIYIGFICFLLLTNLTNLLMVFMVLKNHFKTLSVFTVAIIVNKWCYLPISLLIIEIFKNQITKYLFGYEISFKPINIYYVSLLMIIIVLIICYLLSILTAIKLP